VEGNAKGVRDKELPGGNTVMLGSKFRTAKYRQIVW